jgi:hypothetical protein
VGIAEVSGWRALHCSGGTSPQSVDEHPAAYNFPFTNGDMIMEADEINVIANTLADIAQRTAELRRYL